jgi:hypothetical protein
MISLLSFIKMMITMIYHGKSKQSATKNLPNTDEQRDDKKTRIFAKAENRSKPRRH